MTFNVNFHKFIIFLFTGVADGVGGWRSYGIDPGDFSAFLMKTCERLVQCANFNSTRPVNLLAYSYCELLEHKKPILGKNLKNYEFYGKIVFSDTVALLCLCLFQI